MATSTIKNTLTDLRNSNPLYTTTTYSLGGDNFYWDKLDTKSLDDGVNLIVTTRGKRLKRKIPVVTTQPPAPDPVVVQPPLEADQIPYNHEWGFVNDNSNGNIKGFFDGDVMNDVHLGHGYPTAGKEQWIVFEFPA